MNGKLLQRLSVTLIIVSGASPVLGVPGEDCSTAQSITLPHTENFDNASSLAGSPSPLCNSSGQTQLQNDVWYVFTTDITCQRLVIEVDSLAGYTELVSLYSGPDCGTLVQNNCVIRQDIDDPTLLSASVVPLTQYWVQIGKRGSSPDGGLTSFHAFCPVCGNSIVETTEQCDDGNLINGDGCQSNCVETQPPNDACETASPLPDGTTGFDLASTVGGPSVDCGSFTRSFTLDIWYDYIASCDGALVVNTCGSNNSGAHITAYDGPDCPVDFFGFLSCSGTAGCGSSAQELITPVSLGQSVKIRVGRTTGYGQGEVVPDVLNATCVPTVCGNGVVELAEGCDDANTVDDDGCDSNCRPTGCGNGVVTSGEQCDDRNTENGDGCSATCQSEGPCSCVTAFDCRNSFCAFNNACNCNQCVNGFCEFTCTKYGDINCSGSVTLDDILESLSSFAGNSVLHNGDVAPCGGNGIVNVDDILTVLQAFGGANPCGCNTAAAATVCGSFAP